MGWRHSCEVTDAAASVNPSPQNVPLDPMKVLQGSLPPLDNQVREPPSPVLRAGSSGVSVCCVVLFGFLVRVFMYVCLSMRELSLECPTVRHVPVLPGRAANPGVPGSAASSGIARPCSKYTHMQSLSTKKKKPKSTTRPCGHTYIHTHTHTHTHNTHTCRV